MIDVQDKRVMMAATRKAMETAERVMSVADEEARADFVDAVVTGAVERLRDEGHSTETVLLWRATFFGSYLRQTTSNPDATTPSEAPI